MEDEVSKRLEKIETELAPWGARLLPVTKTFPAERILEAYNAGYRDFAENKVQEILEKREVLPRDIRWYIIGHLQTNKVKYIAPFIHQIQSVDSEKLLSEINKQAFKAGRVISCLLQVYIASEDTKSGWNPLELEDWFEKAGPASFPHVQIDGLMGMATFTSNQEQVRKEFASLRQLRDRLRSQYSFANVSLKELSMGMSGDYILACQEGSTLVRMGTAIFGTR
jgi:pyridoxal phosphate enzyme (YggS family)